MLSRKTIAVTLSVVAIAGGLWIIVRARTEPRDMAITSPSIVRSPDLKKPGVPPPEVKAANPSRVETPKQPRLNRKPEDVLQSLFSSHKSAREGDKDRSSDLPRFEYESRLFYREGRLLALAFPKEVEILATKNALDVNQPVETRLYSEYLLRVIAEHGSVAALNTLLTLAREATGEVKDFALYGISLVDSEGRYRDVYLANCRSGSPTAYDIVSHWLDQATLTEMKLQLGGPNALHAEEVLRRLDVLADARCDDRLENLLHYNSLSDFNDPLEWALRSLKTRSPERLVQALRTELDRTLDGAQDWWKTAEAQQTFEAAYTTRGKLGIGSWLWKSHYDDYLVSYWQAGGKLRDLEKARLANFGYGCDPEARLAELLGEK
jgi:hypothetical protein